MIIPYIFDKNNPITGSLGNPYEGIEVYITEETDVSLIRECSVSSKAINITTGDVWIKIESNKWQKLGSTDVKET